MTDRKWRCLLGTISTLWGVVLGCRTGPVLVFTARNLEPVLQGTCHYPVIPLIYPVVTVLLGLVIALSPDISASD